MKKSLVALLVLGLLAGALAVEAGAKKKKPAPPRVAEAEYVAPAAFQWNPTGDANIGGVSFPTSTGEYLVDLEIADASGMPVSAAAGQDPEGDGTVTTTDFCGSIEDLAIEPGLDVTVFVFPGPCTTPPGPGFATQGTVTATFTP